MNKISPYILRAYFNPLVIRDRERYSKSDGLKQFVDRHSRKNKKARKRK